MRRRDSAIHHMGGMGQIVMNGCALIRLNGHGPRCWSAPCNSHRNPPETASRRTCRTHGGPQRCLAVYSRPINLSCEIDAAKPGGPPRTCLPASFEHGLLRSRLPATGDRSASSEANAHGRFPKYGQIILGQSGQFAWRISSNKRGPLNGVVESRQLPP
jgi:hypothetical protein